MIVTEQYSRCITHVSYKSLLRNPSIYFVLGNRVFKHISSFFLIIGQHKKNFKTSISTKSEQDRPFHIPCITHVYYKKMRCFHG